ncbi:MAG: hypothetical protein KTR33_10885, partial [Gammaproteobacteria bacterium]|nr:hypothetical protein [Gammaproteobacteria bacterium]
MIKSLIVFTCCTFTASALALDFQQITQQLGSEDYTARQNARLDLKAELAKATAPGAADDSLQSLQQSVIGEMD